MRLIAATLISIACGCVGTVRASETEYVQLQFYRAVEPNPPTAADPFLTLARDPTLEACDPCKVIEWRDPIGRSRILNSSTEASATMGMKDFDDVVVREVVSFSEGSSFFVVELELTEEGRRSGRVLSNLNGRRVAVLIGGEVVGYEATSGSWRGTVRIARFLSEDSAMQLAHRIGDPRIERLSEEERAQERERFLSYAAEVFWENQCAHDQGDAPDSEDDAWQSIKKAYPEIEQRIDCSTRPEQ